MQLSSVCMQLSSVCMQSSGVCIQLLTPCVCTAAHAARGGCRLRGVSFLQAQDPARYTEAHLELCERVNLFVRLESKL